MIRSIDKLKLAVCECFSPDENRSQALAIASKALRNYEKNGVERFLKETQFKALENLQAKRSTPQIVWDCVFGSKVTKVFETKKKEEKFFAEYLALKVLLSDYLKPADKEELEKSFPFIIETLDEFEKSKGFIRKVSDFIFRKNDIKEAMAIIVIKKIEKELAGLL